MLDANLCTQVQGRVVPRQPVNLMKYKAHDFGLVFFLFLCVGFICKQLALAARISSTAHTPV